MSVVTSSNHGQIVIPKDIRERLNIFPGKKLLIKTKRDQAIITPLPDDPVEYFYRGLHQNRPNFPVLEPFADRFVPTRVCRPLFFTADSSHLMFLASFL